MPEKKYSPAQLKTLAVLARTEPSPLTEYSEVACRTSPTHIDAISLVRYSSWTVAPHSEPRKPGKSSCVE